MAILPPPRNSQVFFRPGENQGPFGSQDPGWIQAKSTGPRICVRREIQARNADAGLVSPTKTQWIRPRAISAIWPIQALKINTGFSKTARVDFTQCLLPNGPLLYIIFAREKTKSLIFRVGYRFLYIYIYIYIQSTYIYIQIQIKQKYLYLYLC